MKMERRMTQEKLASNLLLKSSSSSSAVKSGDVIVMNSAGSRTMEEKIDTSMWTRTRKRLERLQLEEEARNVNDTTTTTTTTMMNQEDWTRKPSILFAIQHGVDVYDRSNSGKQRKETPEKLRKMKTMEKTFQEQIRSRIFPSKRSFGTSSSNEKRKSRQKNSTLTASPISSKIKKSSKDSLFKSSEQSAEIIHRLEQENIIKNKKLKKLRNIHNRISRLASEREIRIRQLETECAQLKRDLSTEKILREKERELHKSKLKKLKRFGFTKPKYLEASSPLRKTKKLASLEEKAIKDTKSTTQKEVPANRSVLISSNRVDTLEQFDIGEDSSSHSSSSTTSEDRDEIQDEEDVPIIHHPVIKKIGAMYINSPELFGGNNFDRLREICSVMNATKSNKHGLTPQNVALSIRALGITHLSNQDLRYMEKGMARRYGQYIDIDMLILDLRKYLGGC